MVTTDFSNVLNFQNSIKVLKNQKRTFINVQISKKLSNYILQKMSIGFIYGGSRAIFNVM
jgi:hypothetical protein